MKLTLYTMLAICLVVTSATSDNEYDYEEEAAPAAAPASTRTFVKSGKLGSLLSSRNRGFGHLAVRKSPTTTAPATISVRTTSTTQQTVEPTEEDFEEVVEEGTKQDITTTTTTEQPKKFGRGTAVRPFRSNEDLLAALKRRRAQGTTSFPRTVTTEASVETTPTKAKSSAHSKIRSNTDEIPKSTNRQKFGGSRSKIAAATVQQEEAQETRSEDVKSKLYNRRG